ncbi:hypothetical protein WOA01_04800 [Methylocystis sp. IM2]|uniref:hypothetical protein n=1 Tax=Methylocystis sp. IM2 TaxID=3136563 RepID=UPI0030F65323
MKVQAVKNCAPDPLAMESRGKLSKFFRDFFSRLLIKRVKRARKGFAGEKSRYADGAELRIFIHPRHSSPRWVDVGLVE